VPHVFETQGAPADAVFFWSNKLHRGPAAPPPGADGKVLTRDVLFVSWGWRGVSVPSKSTESATDYQVFDTHLDPKLQLSRRGGRRAKRARTLAA
jgi:hypothetical protein